MFLVCLAKQKKSVAGDLDSIVEENELIENIVRQHKEYAMEKIVQADGVVENFDGLEVEKFQRENVQEGNSS